MKKISKIFSVFLAILMVVCTLPISASATDLTLTMTSDVNDVKVGDTVTININLSENSNLNVLTFDVVYDDSKLKYESHSLYGICGVEEVNPSYADEKFRFTCANLNPITSGGTFLTIKFNVLESSCNTVSLNIIESAGNDFVPISTTFSPVILHSFGDWQTVTEPECETAGEKSKSCSCGTTVTESVDALDHDYATEYTVDKEPECKETGSKSQHCSRCDSVQNVTEIPATGHSFGEWTTETKPTCTTEGQENRTCPLCGEIETQAIPVLGHTEEEIPAVEPKCTETGLTAGVKCSECGEILTEQTVVPETGHDYKEKITKIPTHTENGEKTFTCNDCGHTYTEVIEANGDHQYIPSVTKEPTCTDTGVMTYVCACGDDYTEEISALGHTSADAVVENYIAPKCTDNGSKDIVVYCSICDAELSRETEEVDALGHTEEEMPAVEPTCTETGLTEGTQCSVCDEILTAQEEIPATGHAVNKDGYCDNCDEKLCDHSCHKSGISGFFWKIANFFNKLFGTKKYCECGYAHY